MPRAYSVKRNELCRTPTAPIQNTDDVIGADFADVSWMEKVRSWKDAGTAISGMWMSTGQDSREVDDVNWKHGRLLAERAQHQLRHTASSREPLGGYDVAMRLLSSSLSAAAAAAVADYISKNAAKPQFPLHDDVINATPLAPAAIFPQLTLPYATPTASPTLRKGMLSVAVPPPPQVLPSTPLSALHQLLTPLSAGIATRRPMTSPYADFAERQMAVSASKSSDNEDDETATSSKYNPFANSAPLTSDIDTNRLYPRMSRTKTTPVADQPVLNRPLQPINITQPKPDNSLQRSSNLSTTTHDICLSERMQNVHAASAAYINDLISQRRRHLSGLSPPNIPPFQALLQQQKSEVRGGDYRRFDGKLVMNSPRDVTAVDAAASIKSPKTIPKISSSSSAVVGRYRCADCQKTYSTVGGLSKHRQFYCHGDNRHRSQQAATASGCPVVTSSEVTSASSVTVRNQRCPQCDKSYTSASALKMHIRTHTLPCRCRLCGKAFSRPWLLQGHLRTHTGEKPFECPHCSRAFADRSNLRAHLQTHYDVKQYHCPVCRRTFSRMSLLLKHRYGPCAAASSSPSSSSSAAAAAANASVGVNRIGDTVDMIRLIS